MKKHPLLSILVGIVVLLLLAVLLAPLFINANTFRPTLESQLSDALGRKVTLGKLSFSIFSGSLVADNVSIADDPAFSPKPFLQAQSLHIGVEVVPLLLHRQLIVTSFVADEPSINLVHNAQGIWNFSNIGSNAASRTQNDSKESALPNFTVGELKVVNGTATVSDQPATGAPFVYSKLNLTAEKFSFAKSFPYSLSADLPAGGTLSAKGNAGPVNQKDASATPLTSVITLKHFDPVAAGVLGADQGISMLADITAQVTSNGQTLNSNGTVNAARLKLVANGAPTPNPVDITYTVSQNLETRSGQISDLGIKTGRRNRACERNLRHEGIAGGAGPPLVGPEPADQPGRGLITRRGGASAQWLELAGGNTHRKPCHQRTGHSPHHQRSGPGRQHPPGWLRSLVEDWRFEARLRHSGRHADSDGAGKHKLVCGGHAS